MRSTFEPSATRGIIFPRRYVWRFGALSSECPAPSLLLPVCCVVSCAALPSFVGALCSWPWSWADTYQQLQAVDLSGRASLLFHCDSTHRGAMFTPSHAG